MDENVEKELKEASKKASAKQKKAAAASAKKEKSVKGVAPAPDAAPLPVYSSSRKLRPRVATAATVIASGNLPACSESNDESKEFSSVAATAAVAAAAALAVTAAAPSRRRRRAESGSKANNASPVGASSSASPLRPNALQFRGNIRAQVGPPTRTLRNLGNTCFFNALMQCLLNQSSIAVSLYAHYITCQRRDAPGGCIHCDLRNLRVEMGDLATLGSVEPLRMQNRMVQMGFALGAQNDPNVSFECQHNFAALQCIH